MQAFYKSNDAKVKNYHKSIKFLETCSVCPEEISTL